MEYSLGQRGRSSLDFSAAVGKRISRLSAAAGKAAHEAGLSEQALAEDLDERNHQILAVAEQQPAFRVGNLFREWFCEASGRIAVEAFDDVSADLAPRLDRGLSGASTLTIKEGFAPPQWWSQHWIHRTYGGWDGHPYMGFVHAELVHRYLVARISVGDIYAQRRKVAEYLPDIGRGRILEIGCSSGPYTLTLARRFPNADITACDISIRQLEQAQRRLNEVGAGVRFIQCSGEATDFAAGSFDLVTSYAILHEMPVAPTQAVFREAFRVLKPGGALVFADVPPYRELSKLMQWKADYAARHEGEPFWRESAILDVSALLSEIGFTDVRRFGMTAGPYPFPYITEAKKPS